jgi:hypothetical protein
VRLLMRDARSSPSAISFRTVDRAHWSFALTCATDSSFETGIFLCPVSIFRASMTVRTLAVRYVVERGAFLGIDGLIGKNEVNRLEGCK